MNRQIAFHGVDAKVGTTMVSQAAAQLIAAANRDQTVIWVGLNSKAEAGYLGRAGSVEQLQVDLKHCRLSRQDLIDCCEQKENLYSLPGVLSYTAARYYRPDAAKGLLEQLDRHFDIVVVDTGNQLDDGLTIGALEQIPCRIGLFTQQESALKRWSGLRPLYDRLEFDFSAWVLNRYLVRDPYDKAYVTARCGIAEEDLLPVPEAASGRRAEAEERTLLAYRETEFREGIDRLVQRLGWSGGRSRRSLPKGERKWSFFQ